MKEDEMGTACGKHAGVEKCMTNPGRKSRNKDLSRVVDRTITLK
jgi:hypothetical protein